MTGAEFLQECADQTLHVVWFYALAGICWYGGVTKLRYFLAIASMVILPRELIDQWHGWPIGLLKWLDIGCCYFGTVFGWFVSLLAPPRGE